MNSEKLEKVNISIMLTISDSIVLLKKHVTSIDFRDVNRQKSGEIH